MGNPPEMERIYSYDAGVASTFNSDATHTARETEENQPDRQFYVWDKQTEMMEMISSTVPGPVSWVRQDYS
jgi:hypothetical protein